MAAPLAKGLIITASVLVAVGIACYENEQVREWILNARGKIAMALHSLGDEINPPSNEDDDTPEAAALRRRRRQEVIRLNRLDLVRQARADGIAVDLDQLMQIGSDLEESPTRSTNERAGKGFDDLLGADGMLKRAGQTTGADNGASGLRHRGAGGRGFDSGITAANPFDDEAQFLFDRELLGPGDENLSSRESTRTLSPDSKGATGASATSPFFSEDELEAQIEEAIRRSIDDLTLPNMTTEPLEDLYSSPSTENSYYYAPPPNVHQPPASAQSLYSSAMEAMIEANLHNPQRQSDDAKDADDELRTPTGVLTPTEDGFSTTASIVDSHAGDVAVLSDLRSLPDEYDETTHADVDARSEATSETFSMVGTSTPGSWTDVESEAGEEEGHQAQLPSTTVLAHDH